METTEMTIEIITAMQKQYGYTEIQDLINSGQAWLREGSVGRGAMDCLQSGACMLPLVPRKDYWGNIVPPRNVIQAGACGSLENSQNFWQKVNDGEIIMNEDVEEEIP